MNYLLMNPLANNGTGENAAKAAAEKLSAQFPGLEMVNVLSIDHKEFISGLKAEDNVILCGGDGTLNHLCNALDGYVPEAGVYLYQAGTGNDFMNDVRDEVVDGLVKLNGHLKGLPKADINGKTYYFINGIGFGIDGEACRVADEQKAAGKKKINYTSISINLLLFKFKRPTATIVLDDNPAETYKKVCIASAMYGRYYGGGMNIAPDQKRDEHYLTSTCFYGGTRIGTLMVFPKIFEGKHVGSKKFIARKAKKIHVEFDHPCALQVDGETVLNVREFTAYID
ncbi:MAG: diacylglycerol kinase family protein [Bacilli bacterium]|nr:diacylglycerol kinase family protein [Bacilli bacterium]